MDLSILNDLTLLLKQRYKDADDGSYSASLFKGGIDRILKKVGEEAGEVIIAAKNKNKDEVANEVADLLFHVLVMLQDQSMTLDDVLNVLRQRFDKKNK